MNVYHYYSQKIQDILPETRIPINPGDFHACHFYGDLSLPLAKYGGLNQPLDVTSLYEDPFTLTAEIQNGFLNLTFKPELWHHKLDLFLNFHKKLIEKKQDYTDDLMKQSDKNDQFILWSAHIFIETVQKYFNKTFNSNFLLYKNNQFQYLTTKAELAMIATLALLVWDQPRDSRHDALPKILKAYNALRYKMTSPDTVLRFIDPNCQESSHAKVLLLTAIDLTLVQLTKEKRL